jgi:hypothetical protein
VYEDWEQLNGCCTEVMKGACPRPMTLIQLVCVKSADNTKREVFCFFWGGMRNGPTTNFSQTNFESGLFRVINIDLFIRLFESPIPFLFAW